MSINEEIGRLHGKAPMDQSEVAAIARSVDRKRREWIAKGSYYSSEQRTLWGHTERGRKDSWPGKWAKEGESAKGKLHTCRRNLHPAPLP